MTQRSPIYSSVSTHLSIFVISVKVLVELSKIKIFMFVMNGQKVMPSNGY